MMQKNNQKEIGENYFKEIVEISEPIAAASIAQVHLAKIKINGNEKQVAIKILRPEIEKLFNEELDALMLFAYNRKYFFKIEKIKIS